MTLLSPATAVTRHCCHLPLLSPATATAASASPSCRPQNCCALLWGQTAEVAVPRRVTKGWNPAPQSRGGTREHPHRGGFPTGGTRSLPDVVPVPHPACSWISLPGEKLLPPDDSVYSAKDRNHSVVWVYLGRVFFSRLLFFVSSCAALPLLAELTGAGERLRGRNRGI